MTARNVVAVDLGAESGRVVLGRFDGSRVALEELHRFSTPPRQDDGHLRWDLHRLWSEIQTGLAGAGAVGTVDAVGVDSWGVDYGLLGRDGELLGDPVRASAISWKIVLISMIWMPVARYSRSRPTRPTASASMPAVRGSR